MSLTLGKGFGVGFRWALGGALPVGNEGEGEGGGEGGGWGGDMQRNRQVNAHAFVRKLPFVPIECFRGRHTRGRKFTSSLRFSEPFLRAAK